MSSAAAVAAAVANVEAETARAAAGQNLQPASLAPSLSMKPVPAGKRDVQKNSQGLYECTWRDCTEETHRFGCISEYKRHMDKHKRPYRCFVGDCEKLPGFTRPGDLVRHEREVHGKHGGPVNLLDCPYHTCKRSSGKPFSRPENLNSHMRHVHPSDTEQCCRRIFAQSGQCPPETADAGANGDNVNRNGKTAIPLAIPNNKAPASAKAAAPAANAVALGSKAKESLGPPLPSGGLKRMASSRISDDDPHEEMKRIRLENKELRWQVELLKHNQQQIQQQYELNNVLGSTLSPHTKSLCIKRPPCQVLF